MSVVLTNSCNFCGRRLSHDLISLTKGHTTYNYCSLDHRAKQIKDWKQKAETLAMIPKEKHDLRNLVKQYKEEAKTDPGMGDKFKEFLTGQK